MVLNKYGLHGQKKFNITVRTANRKSLKILAQFYGSINIFESIQLKHPTEVGNVLMSKSKAVQIN